MIRCSKNCEARAVGCHSDCAAYIAEKAELTAENERERAKHDDYRGYGVYASLKQRWRKKI